MIVTAQSIAMRHGRGRLRVMRSTGFRDVRAAPVGVYADSSPRRARS